MGAGRSGPSNVAGHRSSATDGRGPTSGYRPDADDQRGRCRIGRSTPTRRRSRSLRRGRLHWHERIEGVDRDLIKDGHVGQATLGVAGRPIGRARSRRGHSAGKERSSTYARCYRVVRFRSDRLEEQSDRLKDRKAPVHANSSAVPEAADLPATETGHLPATEGGIVSATKPATSRHQTGHFPPPKAASSRPPRPATSQPPKTAACAWNSPSRSRATSGRRRRRRRIGAATPPRQRVAAAR
jgi:hypothetical protein